MFFSTHKEECFICCSVDGKNDNEKTFEMLYASKKLDYPLIKLSNAYNCKCTMHAHNKCLLFINKCPTCRKVVHAPNIYVVTKYDYYLYYLLEWLKHDILRIQIVKTYVICCMFLVWLLLYCYDKKQLETIIPPNSNNYLCIAFIVVITYVGGLQMILLEDYFRKYWLYDPKLNKCYALNN